MERNVESGRIEAESEWSFIAASQQYPSEQKKQHTSKPFNHKKGKTNKSK